MNFRQIHLDFHTSERIPDIGACFSREQFQHALKLGHVNHINIFAKCHHGWAYFPSKTNAIHPGLSFDLLGEMLAAAHEIGAVAPVYVSAGLDEKQARQRPDWVTYGVDEHCKPVAPRFDRPGYHLLCFNTPYLDILLDQIAEVTERYPLDGLWLDIVAPRMCLCPACQKTLLDEGQDPGDRDAVRALGERVYAHYTRRVREVVDAIKPGLPVFHNGGHIQRGRRDLAYMNSQLELESLPTGGWGYDHFPLSARYVQQLDREFLGMTGKFHTTWGEFGGFKHPNALRYESALILASGGKVNVGDQMHPSGLMDENTYRLIGTAFAEVEQKEAWCDQVTSVADVGLLSAEAAGNAAVAGHKHSSLPDTGAVRMLLEGHYLFDVLDVQSDFSLYKVIVLPDCVLVDGELREKLSAYVRGGGQVLATGSSAQYLEGGGFALDLGACHPRENAFMPDYVRPHFDLPALGRPTFICYGRGTRVDLARDAQELAAREDPYFNRTAFGFCSHQHTPSSGRGGGPGMTRGAHGVYIAWEIFSDYATKGTISLKYMVHHALNLLLEGKKTLCTTLPAQGVTTLQHQAGQSRYVHHLLYASPVRRGENIEVIEDLLPIYDIEVCLRLPVTRAYLAPQGTPLPLTAEDGCVRYVLPKLECHQMVVLE